MSGLKDVKFLIPQSADEFIEQAPGQYDAMKKAVREATMDNHDEPMSVDDFVRSHSQLFILIKSAVREVLHEDAPAVQAQGRGHGPFSDLFEADGASSRSMSVEEYVIGHPLEYGLVRKALADESAAESGLDTPLGVRDAGNSFGERVQAIEHLLLPILAGRERCHDEPRFRGFGCLFWIHVITSLLCAGVLIVSLKLAGKEVK